MAIRERLDTLSRGELAGLAVIVVAVLAGAGLWYSRSLPKPIQVAVTPAASPVAPVSGSASATPTGAPLIVDVTGWVKAPGVYEFDPGARVIDAVDRAGGPRDGADLSLLNLAAPLTDGQQILVPKEGAAPAAPGTVPGAAPGTVPGAAPGTTGTQVNINTADATALETLNGVGEVLAAAIVTYRDEHGPFTSVDQLEEVPGIGPSTLEELRDQVTI
jgi:competence protein ComEA